jgi:hypothetical protein
MSKPVAIKLAHRDLRSCVVTVPLPSVPLPFSPTYGIDGRCPTCMVIHPHKTIHLNVDADGTCLVSTVVFAALRGVGAIDEGERPPEGPAVPFTYVGEVVEPPPLNLRLGPRIGDSPVIAMRITDAEGKVIYEPLRGVVNIHTDGGR